MRSVVSDEPAHGPDDEYDEWRRPAGIFVLAPLAGPVADAIHELQRRFDPKLAAAYVPHVTLAGSSGVGPIRPGTPIDTIEARLAPVARSTPPLQLRFGRPYRFMQTNIISLPLDVHGPLRALHDAIARSGLPFAPARFTFTPHVTLTLYRTLTAEAERTLLSVRLDGAVTVDRLALSMTEDAGSPRILATVPLGPGLSTTAR